MSLCSKTLRALSQSRIPASRTLLPFLYQTATMQQRQPATRRSMSSRPTAEDDIPFGDADGNVPPTADEPRSSRKTTITGTERAAFEQLYRTATAQGRGQAKDSAGEHEELDQIADEYYEDDDDGSAASLDKVFDTVLQGSLRSPNAQRDRRRAPAREARSPIRPGQEPSSAKTDAPQSKKALARLAEKERIRKLRLEERERVDGLLKTAATDQQLWKTLNREVFDQLRKLDLDGTSPTHKTDASATRIVFSNYPHHLLTAIQTLCIHFPTSPLPLTILPTIKALGRSSYALGATTQLYKHLLRTAWLQQSSYTLIDTLLTDMETNIVEFDVRILDFLDAVIREHEAARSGRLGREMQMVYGMEMWIEGARKMRSWRSVVAERLGIADKVVGQPE
ncbi:hypothetical protein CC86DRAFT_252067, partial [Ophiobolus disseminans]